VVELPRLRLPLPERTGSDRDELRCPHGFVDRAYSVFLLRLRCCELHNHCYFNFGQLVLRPSLLCSTAAPIHRRTLARLWIEARNEGTSPRAHRAPVTATTTATPWEMSIQPAVEVRKAACRWRCPTRARRFRTRETSLPQQDLLPPSAREPEASRPVSARPVLQSACQSPARSAPDSTRSCIPWVSITLRGTCLRGSRGCDGSGAARCHRGRGDDTDPCRQPNRKRRSAFATVTPEVTLHDAVTRA